MGTQLTTIPNGSLQKEIIINNNFKSLANNAFLSINENNINGLQLHYFGGDYIDDTGTEFTLNNGFITLTASNTFYIEFDITTQLVESNTIGFTNGKIPMAIVSTDATRIVSISQKKTNKILKKGESSTAVGLPTGGTTNQILAKNSNTNYDVEWVDPPSGGGGSGGLPAGGATGQILAKIDGTDYNTEWIDPPSGGGGVGASSTIFKFLTSNVNNNSNVDGLLSDWTFTIPPLKKCRLSFNLIYQTPTTTDGARAGLLIQSGDFTPGNLLIGNCTFIANLSGNPSSNAMHDADAIALAGDFVSVYKNILSTGSTANTDTGIKGDAIFYNQDSTGNGTVSIYIASEVNGTTISFRQGSSVVFEVFD